MNNDAVEFQQEDTGSGNLIQEEIVDDNNSQEQPQDVNVYEESPNTDQGNMGVEEESGNDSEMRNDQDTNQENLEAESVDIHSQEADLEEIGTQGDNLENQGEDNRDLQETESQILQEDLQTQQQQQQPTQQQLAQLAQQPVQPRSTIISLTSNRQLQTPTVFGQTPNRPTFGSFSSTQTGLF